MKSLEKKKARISVQRLKSRENTLYRESLKRIKDPKTRKIVNDLFEQPYRRACRINSNIEFLVPHKRDNHVLKRVYEQIELDSYNIKENILAIIGLYAHKVF